MGWRGSARHWKRYESAYLLLAGLATPLVLSVHTVVSFDFAVAIVPGWHTTIFPPYFVAGAIYSGFAMVLVLAIPIRQFYGLEDMITMRHLENAAKVMLATGLIVAYGYFMETFIGLLQRSTLREVHVAEPHGSGRMRCSTGADPLQHPDPAGAVVPQGAHQHHVLFLISLDMLIGMWLERFVIVVTSLHRDFLPSSWGHYVATRWDYMTFFGTIGFFFAAMFLFIRLMPMISIFEMRMLLPQAAVERRRSANEPRRSSCTLRLDGGVRNADRLGAWRRRAAHDAGYRKMDAYSPYPDGRGGRSDRFPQDARAADRADGRRFWAAWRLTRCSTGSTSSTIR